jgi:hypothetical protein
MHPRSVLSAIRCRKGLLARALFACAATLAMGGSSAHAYFYYNVFAPGNVKVGVVAEQIVPSPLGLDYQYNLLNVSPTLLAIKGFSVSVGTPPAGLVGLAQQVNVIPPQVNPGAFLTNPLVGVPFLNAEGNAFSPVPWQFQEFDNRAPGPLSKYVIHWSATGGQPLPFKRWTRFDLFSPFGPVAGGGAVDPPDFSGPGDLGLDFVDPNGIDEGSTFVADEDTTDFSNSAFEAGDITDDPGDPNDVAQDPDAPNPFAADGFTDVSEEFQPEPASLALLASGLFLMQCRRLDHASSWKKRPTAWHKTALSFSKDV